MKKGGSGSWPVGCSALHNLRVKLASPFLPIVPILPILQANRVTKQIRQVSAKPDNVPYKYGQ